ncbi:MAG: DUF3168 domain-containing protein [Gemmatimonadales bacterium]|nr:DUF3168 domain-containing protein [Gemmatimonadales bacterium]
MSGTLELIAAIVPRLKAWPALAAIVGDRVLDPVPAATPTPYVSLGPITGFRVDADCIPGVEVTVQVDAWSTRPGLAEVLRMASAIEESLHSFETDLGAGSALAVFSHRLTTTLRDPDGVTTHAVVQFTAVIENP